MIYFNNDYSEGCHEAILEKLAKTNLEQTPGYGEDLYCREAADLIRKLCNCDDLAVHFLVGGTQANLTVIAAALRAHQGVLSADSGHIHVHETGAVEATGHKVLALSSVEGKLSGKQVADYVRAHRADASFEHMAQPKMVYISNPTEWGTLYTLSELEELSDACKQNGLYLFLDGARLGYGMMARGNDISMEDLARLCDVFYIGGTKVGALFGEAVVISNPALKEDFRYVIKQKGGMLAKGRLLGVQFCALLENNLYFEIAAHADRLADKLRSQFSELGFDFYMSNTTNQLFPILPKTVRDALKEKYAFIEMEQIDEDRRVCRFCTSWATKEENVDALCADLKKWQDGCNINI